MAVTYNAAYYALIRTYSESVLTYIELQNGGSPVGSARIAMSDGRVVVTDNSTATPTVKQITLKSTDSDLSGVTAIDGYKIFQNLTGGSALVTSSFTALALDATHEIVITLTQTTPS